MKLRYIICLAALMGASVISACDETSDANLQCNSLKDVSRCSHDGRSIIVCQNNNTWEEASCSEGTECMYLMHGASCLAPVGTGGSGCTPGSKACSGNFLLSCRDDGVWSANVCAAGCADGACKESEKPSTLNGILNRRCSADRQSVETVYSDGRTESRTCLEEVGFKTNCEEFSLGNAGCVLPESCDENFSVQGTCSGDFVLGCNTDFIDPKPYVKSCAAVGGHCAEVSGKADCRAACGAPSGPACTSSGKTVSACRKTDSGTGTVIAEGDNLCRDENTSVSCADGKLKETACVSGQKCLDSLGICAESCTEAELNSVKCDAAGNMMLCQAIHEGFAYVSVGKRHCLGDTLVSCILSGTEYAVKETDCRNFVNDNGQKITASCEMDFQYPDMDICYPVDEGKPCSGVTENGECSGSTLRYCNEKEDVLIESNCGTNSCSIVHEIADCRASCKKAGNASCTYSEKYMSYILTLCSPDDKTGALSEVEGMSICLGDVLYSCDSKGNTAIHDCASDGGRCDVTQCVYPVCSQSISPVCLADDAMMTCQADSATGTVTGIMMKSMDCDAAGNCRVCRNGAVTAMQ